MTEPVTNEQNRGLVVSFVAHATLIAFLILKNVFFESDVPDYQSAIRVDIVALPDKDMSPPSSTAASTPSTVAEKPAPSRPEPERSTTDDPPTTEALPDKKPVVDEEAIKLTETKKALEQKKKKDEEKRRKEALDKIKKMSALESIKSSVETERIEKLVSHSESKAKTTYKGNVLNAGTELTGINKIQHENYVALLDRQIKENWTLPQWLVNKDLKAQALVKIDSNGIVIYNQIYKSSGNPNYDDIVKETIQKSGPFPKPPEKFSAILSDQGVLIGFPE